MRNFTLVFITCFLCLGISTVVNAQKTQLQTTTSNGIFLKPIDVPSNQNTVIPVTVAAQKSGNVTLPIAPIQKQEQPKAVVNPLPAKSISKRVSIASKPAKVNSDGFISKSVKAYKPLPQIQ